MGCGPSEQEWWNAVISRNKDDSIKEFIRREKNNYGDRIDQNLCNNELQHRGYTAIMYFIEYNELDLFNELFGEQFIKPIKYRQLLNIKINNQYIKYLTPKGISVLTFTILLNRREIIREAMTQSQQETSFLISLPEDKSDLTCLEASVLTYRSQDVDDKNYTNDIVELLKNAGIYNKMLENESKRIINCLTIAVYTNNKIMIKKLVEDGCQELIDSFSENLDLRSYFGLDCDKILANEQDFNEAVQYFKEIAPKQQNNQAQELQKQQSQFQVYKQQSISGNNICPISDDNSMKYEIIGIQSTENLICKNVDSIEFDTQYTEETQQTEDMESGYTLIDDNYEGDIQDKEIESIIKFENLDKKWRQEFSRTEDQNQKIFITIQFDQFILDQIQSKILAQKDDLNEKIFDQIQYKLNQINTYQYIQLNQNIDNNIQQSINQIHTSVQQIQYKMQQNTSQCSQQSIQIEEEIKQQDNIQQDLNQDVQEIVENVVDEQKQIENIQQPEQIQQQIQINEQNIQENHVQEEIKEQNSELYEEKQSEQQIQQQNDQEQEEEIIELANQESDRTLQQLGQQITVSQSLQSVQPEVIAQESIILSQISEKSQNN